MYQLVYSSIAAYPSRERYGQTHWLFNRRKRTLLSLQIHFSRTFAEDIASHGAKERYEVPVPSETAGLGRSYRPDLTLRRPHVSVIPCRIPVLRLGLLLATARESRFIQLSVTRASWLTRQISG